MDTNRATKLGTVVLIWVICTMLATFRPPAEAKSKAYEKLLIEQGYTPLNHPRSNFGPGTIIPLDKNKNIFIATQEECFPGLQDKLNTGATKLLDRVDNTNLNLGASAKYAPGGGGLLGKLAGMFGFNKTAKLDVSFGDASAVDLTQVGLENY